MTTFHQARIKLTAWYLLTIMTLSLLFSLVIYKALTIEIDRFERAQRFFIERRFQERNMPTPPDGRRLFNFDGQPLSPELLAETKQRISLMLVFANTGILIITGGLGYLLAGRTLKPIKEMVDEQDRFITDASHELKTPLTSLRSEFEIAILDEDKLKPEETKRLIRSGFEEIVSLQGLTENLLELTHQQKKISSSLSIEEVSLLDILEMALKRVIPMAKKKHVVINNQIDDFVLKGEVQSLTELFVILLDNAIKYSNKNSKVTLTSNETDHRTEVAIKDSGTGINEKDAPYIFDRFYRADKSRSDNPGYGLGLSIAKKIVETHKGTISFQNNSNRGSTFVVSLPMSKS